MPRIAVPTAPTPTHTAYAVPTGNAFMASPSRYTLIAIDARVAAVGKGRVNPSVYFRPMAQPISNRPATKRTIQFMDSSGVAGSSPWRLATAGSSPPRPARGRADDDAGQRRRHRGPQ